jgi:hypothetical protein
VTLYEAVQIVENKIGKQISLKMLIALLEEGIITVDSIPAKPKFKFGFSGIVLDYMIGDYCV